MDTEMLKPIKPKKLFVQGDTDRMYRNINEK